MKKIKIILPVALACGLAACGKPAPDNPPAPKAPADTATDAPVETAVSTAPPSYNSLLNAPGNYLKSTVGRIDSAKTAVKIAEKSAAEHMDIDEGK